MDFMVAAYVGIPVDEVSGYCRCHGVAWSLTRKVWPFTGLASSTGYCDRKLAKAACPPCCCLFRSRRDYGLISIPAYGANEPPDLPAQCGSDGDGIFGCLRLFAAVTCVGSADARIACSSCSCPKVLVVVLQWAPTLRRARFGRDWEASAGWCWTSVRRPWKLRVPKATAANCALGFPFRTVCPARRCFARSLNSAPSPVRAVRACLHCPTICPVEISEST